MIAARSASILLALFLTGCATSTPEMSIEASVAVDDAEIAETPATRSETSIPDDSLLPLLQAEFALRQRDFDQGLALLAEQAVLLEDPALARRARPDALDAPLFAGGYEGPFLVFNRRFAERIVGNGTFLAACRASLLARPNARPRARAGAPE